MGQAKGCLWYRKGKLRDLGNPGTFEPAVIPNTMVWEEQDVEVGQPEEERDECEPDEVSDTWHQGLFDLIPVQPLPNPVPSRDDHEVGSEALIAGPSNRVQDVEEGRWVVVEHRTAGAIVREGEMEIQCWWRYILRLGQPTLDGDGDVEMLDGAPDRFSPFTSEIEWRVSQWAIQDGIGQRSLDRLLSIPGVSNSTSYAPHKLTFNITI
jgi:hypothetical protein